MKKERIKITFEFDIEYDTAEGRRIAISLARKNNCHISQWGKHGTSIVKRTKKIGTITK